MDLAIFETRFSYAIGSMCAHGFLLLKSSTHNLKQIILTIRLLLRQPGAESSGVFNKDVKVPRSRGGVCGYLFFQQVERKSGQ